MNLGPLIVLLKLFEGLKVSPDVIGPQQFESECYRVDGKLTQACWQKYKEPSGSYTDYQDYLNEK